MSPFTITTKRPGMGQSGALSILPGSYLSELTATVVSCVAVATLEEARRMAAEVALPHALKAHLTDYKALAAACRAISESGGTVGPLPDGTMIEVEPTTWHKLADESGDGTLLASTIMLGDRIEHWPGVRESILVAWNARKATS